MPFDQSKKFGVQFAPKSEKTTHEPGDLDLLKYLPEEMVERYLCPACLGYHLRLKVSR